MTNISDRAKEPHEDAYPELDGFGESIQSLKRLLASSHSTQCCLLMQRKILG